MSVTCIYRYFCGEMFFFIISKINFRKSMEMFIQTMGFDVINMNYWVYEIGLQACNFFKKRLQHRCFPVEFVKLLRTVVVASENK